MRKHNVDEINLKIDAIEVDSGDITIYWSSDIGFGQYSICGRMVKDHPEKTEWVAMSEYMDNNADKAFGEKLLKLWMEQIKIIE